jgi:L-serine dehydratase
VSVFDIIGPRMVGPSSSHTAGALGRTPERATIGLHGSFSTTYQGHGTDRAVVAGLLGMAPDDPGIPDSLAVADRKGLDVVFEPIDLGVAAHPNTLRFDVAAGEESVSLVGASVGGGAVEVSHVNDRAVDLSGRFDTLLIQARDVPGTTATITQRLAASGINIAFLEVAREKRGREATMIIQTDHAIPDSVVDEIEDYEWVISTRRLSKVTD